MGGRVGMPGPQTAPALLHDLVLQQAGRRPDAAALSHGARTLDYAALAQGIAAAAAALAAAGTGRDERVAVWLEPRTEHVLACFGAAAAGAIFVPVNPGLKPAQVRHILRDCGASVLVTSSARAALLAGAAAADAHGGVRAVFLVDRTETATETGTHAMQPGVAVLDWHQAIGSASAGGVAPRCDTDVAAILYTSGSTGAPKGVVLSHRNLVAGAASVAGYLGNVPDDVIAAALPLSFDAGFSQLTTAFTVGARVVLWQALLPRDLLALIDRERVTGLTVVPPLLMQLLAHAPPHDGSGDSLRYVASTGGRMPRATLEALRARWPQAAPVLMYGLTEAFRSTWLPPEELDRRPDSIGRAIPNAQILVLRDDGTPAEVDEPGELVHRGPLVAQGYWRDPERTAARFRPLPAVSGARPEGLPMPEIAVFSGDTVRRDADGYLYFVGRRDEMIKTSGYRVSPTEVEEAAYASGLVGECMAVGVPHAALGEAIALLASPPAGHASLDAPALSAAMRQALPAWMQPTHVVPADGPLARNANGKIDRAALGAALRAQLAGPALHAEGPA